MIYTPWLHRSTIFRRERIKASTKIILEEREREMKIKREREKKKTVSNETVLRGGLR